MRYIRSHLVLLGLLIVLSADGCENLDFSARSKPNALSKSPTTQLASTNLSVVTFDFDGPLQKDGLPTPWQARVIRGSLGVAIVAVPDLASHHALQINCQKSHFLIYNESEPFDPKKFPVLTWSWKAATLPTNGDVRTHDAFYYSGSNRNDKVLQILVAFEGDRVINYSWDTTAPIGTCVDEWSPAAKIKTCIVESGTRHLDTWQQVRVNILSDYQKLYGAAPGKVLGVSVQTNSNHTSSCSAGLVGAIKASKS